MWAIKIFDDGTESFNLEMLDLAKSWGAGIECALYHDKGMLPAVNKRLKSEFSSDPRHGLGLHLSHSKLSLVELSSQAWSPDAMDAAFRIVARESSMTAVLEDEDNWLNAASIRLAREVGWAKKVGTSDAVIHLDRGNAASKDAWKGLDPKSFASRLVPAIQAASLLGIRLHLEKTYESRAWFDILYAELGDLGMAENFGFTFDIGHSRVWQREPLEGWMQTIDKIDKMGFGLHFHLHGNPGDTDRHDTLGLAQAMGWLDPDPEWAPNGAIPILAEISLKYENKALLVLETSPEHARENLGWVELAIRG